MTMKEKVFKRVFLVVLTALALEQSLIGQNMGMTQV